jgi:hypothetical protein
MVKGIIVALLFSIHGCVFAANCPKALPTNSLQFCTSFKTAATCYCTQSGLPAGMCQDMNALYNRMIGVFGSLKKACEFQKYTDVQDCIDNWNCYRLGGEDSRKRLCSSTKNPCQ